MKRPPTRRSTVTPRPRRSSNYSVLSSHSRIDEDDSGLGDTSHFEDSNFSSVSMMSDHTNSLQPHTFISQAVQFSPEYAVVKNQSISNKRLRLDIPEEANELPDQVFYGQTEPITSFKNVPALLSPLTATYSPIISTQDQSPTRKKRTEKVLKRNSRRGNDGSSVSSDGKIEIRITARPEKQHRARYQTEGSRGSVKGEGSAGHPIVKIFGYTQPCFVECFVASNEGPIAPHLFYQACQVNGKNSTPCEQDKQDGVTIIKMKASPENDMTVVCDCVGILKERNVDVEQRLKSLVKGRKKNTKCRLVFRTTIENQSGQLETLQVASDSICCSQPPGVPEISCKSLDKCSALGDKALFIIGKNFLKNTKVIFREIQNNKVLWEHIEEPNKEYLQNGHLVCNVPKYTRTCENPVTVQIIVSSDNKMSEPHMFEYLPIDNEEDIKVEMNGKRTTTSYNQCANIEEGNSSATDEKMNQYSTKFFNEIQSVTRVLQESVGSSTIDDLMKICQESVMNSIIRFIKHEEVLKNETLQVVQPRQCVKVKPYTGPQTKQVVPMSQKARQLEFTDVNNGLIQWQPPEIMDLNSPDSCGEFDPNELPMRELAMFSPDSETSFPPTPMTSSKEQDVDPVLPQFQHQPDLCGHQDSSSQFMHDSIFPFDVPAGIFDCFPLDSGDITNRISCCKCYL